MLGITHLGIGGRDPAAVQVTAAARAVGLGPELAFQLHEAPDPGAIRAEVGSTLAAAARMVARSTPSSSAHRSSGAAIGRPTSGSCQVPTRPGYRTDVREWISNAA